MTMFFMSGLRGRRAAFAEASLGAVRLELPRQAAQCAHLQGGRGRIARNSSRRELREDKAPLRIDPEPLRMDTDCAERILGIAGLVPEGTIASVGEHVGRVAVTPSRRITIAAHINDPGS